MTTTLTPPVETAPAWIDAFSDAPPVATRVMAVLPGEGIGPEVVAAALSVLDALDAVRPLHIRRIVGGAIGLAAEPAQGCLTTATAEFCREIFQTRGTLFCGPGGGRFVYDLRRHFDLFCKIAPLKPSAAVRPDMADVDMLVVRDNAAGVYQGRGTTRTDAAGQQVAEHTFGYSQSEVERVIQTAVRLARQRRGHIHVVVKDGGVPAISNLWKAVTQQIAGAARVTHAFLNADYAAYFMMQNPRAIDILVTPNMIGDILADLGAVLLGSRGLSFSGNFSAAGDAAYQTGHGAAYDLAGTDGANPVGQILSLAMLLRQSFRMADEALLLERAADVVWREGYRTDDLAYAGCRRVGTREMAGRVADAVAALARKSPT